jgi:hypothetical protein
MKLFAPWAMWFLGSVPLIIIMYILKQKFEEREISSVYLWQQVLKDIEVNTPWQKLKKNLLLLLQLLAALLLVLALSDPYVNLKGTDYASLIVVIDNTGSMNAAYDQTTRLEKAKAMAQDLVKNAATGTQLTLITAGRYPKVEASNTKDKQEVLKKIRDIRSSNTAGNINDASSMVSAVSKQAPSYKAVFYTDSGVSLEKLNGEVVSLAKPVGNISLDLLSHNVKDGKLNILLRATNHGSSEAAGEVTLYGNEAVLDIKEIRLKAGESKTFYSKLENRAVSYLWAELGGKDGLASDNTIYDVVKPSKVQKVLLVSQSNLFIEKAFSIIDNVELYKANPGDEIQGEYDLYIYDGTMPNRLPQKGSLLFLNPPASMDFISVKGELEGGTGRAIENSLTKYMEGTSFAVSKLRNVELPYFADEVLEVEGNTAAFVGQYKERKVSVIAFDLHNSDFVLTPEYPIFMHNIAGYLISIGSGERSSYTSGESVAVNAVPDAVAAYIQGADGKKYDIQLKYPILPFENTEETGIYRLVQKVDTGEQQNLFAVNFPSDTESNTNLQLSSEAAGETGAGGFATGKRIAGWLMILVLLIAAVEWGVYIRGY